MRSAIAISGTNFDVFKLVLFLQCLFILQCEARIEPKIDAHQVHDDHQHGGVPQSHIHINIDDDDDDDDDIDDEGDDDDGYYDEDDRSYLSPEDWHALPKDKQDHIIDKFMSHLDENKDGLVSRIELKDAVLRGMQHENNQMSKEEFDNGDTDSSNDITWDEYYGDMEESSYSQDDDVVMAKEMDKYRFKLADVDKTNTLNLKEFQAFFFPYDHPHMKDYLLHKVLTEYDKDSDKQLSLKEFLDIATDHEDFSEHEPAFRLSDVDNNSLLSQEELYELLSNSGNRLAEEEVNWIADKLKKPTIGENWSKEDIGKHIETFLDSQFEDTLLKYHQEL